MNTIAQTDPWAQYDQPGKGKGKGIVPEPSSYGLVLVGFVLLTVVLARWDNRRK